MSSSIYSVSLHAYLEYDATSQSYGALKFGKAVIPDKNETFIIKKAESASDQNAVRIQCGANNEFLKVADDGWLSPVVGENEGDVFEQQTVDVNQQKFQFLHLEKKKYAIAKKDPSRSATRFFVGESKWTPQGDMIVKGIPLTVEETTSEVRENK